MPAKKLNFNFVGIMKRLILSLFLFVQAVQIVCAWNGSIATSYAGGDGSQSNPYQIATAEQLALLAHNVNDEGITYSGQYFILTNDIDLFGLNGTDTIQWTPIGIIAENVVHNGEDAHPDHRYFKGKFDGTNHIISNLYINDSTRMSGGGLFGNVAIGRLQNIKLSNVYVRVHKYASALCANAAYAMFIDNCHVLNGKVVVEHSYAGGIVGYIKSFNREMWSNYNYDEYLYFYNSSITNCTNHATISMSGSSSFANNGNWSMIGGIAGQIRGTSGATFWGSTHVSDSDGKPYSMTIKNCINYGDVTGSVGTGGICGAFTDGNSNGGSANDTVLMDRCINYGTIYYGNIRSGNSVWEGYVGGITGQFIGAGIVQRCLNAGDIKKDRIHDLSGTNFITHVGGIIGHQFATVSRVQYCVNIGNCDSVSKAGGIVGYNRGRINNCLNAGNFSGNYETGGIVGYMQNGFATGCISVYHNGDDRTSIWGGTLGNLDPKGAPPHNLGYDDYFSQSYFDWQWHSYDRSRGEISTDYGQRLTLLMLGNNLQGSLPASEWVFAEGIYPRPKGVENEPIAIVAATPACLKVYEDSTYDDMYTVHDGLEVSTLNGVTWTSESPLQISGTHVAITGAVPSGEKYQLYAHLGEVKKRIEFSVNSFNPDTVLPIDTTVIPIDTTIVNPIDTTHIEPDTTGVVVPTTSGFTINAQGERIVFAPANLLYNAAQGSHLCADGTTHPGTWRFAENISSTYDGWIDLFGFGTSGWNSGANEYQPYASSSSSTDYYVGGGETNSLVGSYAYADWGIFNTIESYPCGTWRTLTLDEWDYLFTSRTDASMKYGQATVNNVAGYILLPDEWVIPAGLTFTPGPAVGYGANTYSLSEWEQMEQAGAVFLPAGGYRQGRSMQSVQANGDYYFSTANSYDATRFYFTSSSSSYSTFSGERYFGRALRLVRTPSATPVVDPVYFSFSDSICAGETYAWEGSKFTEAGEYTKTLVSSLGGDSIVTLHLYSYSCEEVYEDVPFCYEERGLEAVLTIIDGENVNYQWEQKVNGEWQVLSAGYLSQTIQLPTSTTDTIYLRFVGSELLSNLIVNGDFEAGNTGFETGYTYDSLAIYAEGTYTVTNDVNLVHADAQCAEDHTTGEGMMMAINGGSNANANVWTQTVTGLLPNTDYAFSAWAALWTDYGFNYPELEFSINGELQGQRFSPNEGTCNWTQLYTIWNSGNHTSAQIRLVDQQIGEMANDFCIDDIYFSPLLGRLDGAIKYLKVYLLQPIDTTIVYRTINEGDTCSWEGDIYTTAGNYVKTFVSAEGCDSLVMLQLTVMDPLPEDHAFYFSTSDTTAVFFSPGNLQYKATPGTHLCADGTMQQGVWRFAEHQWNYVGTQNERVAISYNVARQHGNVYENGVICDNANASSTYSGWIDLFAYGTSGWNSGVAKYQPWTGSLSDDVYLIESYWSQYFHFGDLTGEYAYADWGVYNQIGEYAPGTWRTPTHDEWIYIVSQRPNADSLRGIGMIDGVPGFILLPDNSRWDSLPFNPGLIEIADMNWSIVSNNTIDYAINPYTSAQWEDMERAGAIFLPAAGDKTQDNWISVYTTHRDPNTHTDVFKQSGDYMSSTFIEHAINAGTPGVKVLDFDPYNWIMNMGFLICNNPQNDLPTPITAPVSAEPQKAKIILQDNTIYILLPDGTRYDATGKKVK